MKIINVLFKGVEIKTHTWCKAFSTEDKARNFIENYCEREGLKIRSLLGWNEEKTMDDYRVEDEDGNTFYFVLYRQELN